MNQDYLRVKNSIKKWIMAAKIRGHRIKEIIEKALWIIPYVALLFSVRIKKVNHDSVLFFCHTPYHVLIAICYTMVFRYNSSILLYKGMNNVDKLAVRLKDSKLFETIEITDYLDNEYYTYEKAFSKFGKTRWEEKCKKIEADHDMSIFANRRIFVFNDSSVVGYYLNCKRIPYVLLEDGLDHYTKESVARSIYKPLYECAFQYYVNTQVQSNGGAPYSREVWVNDASKVVVPYRANFISKPKHELIHSLTENEKQIILQVFEAENVFKSIVELGDGKKTLFLTYPLFVDGVVSSEESQIKMIQEIVAEKSEGRLIIKPHPRDKIDYRSIFPEAYVISRNDIPIEVFDYSGVTFDLGITIGSTSLAGLVCVREKIVLSIEDCSNYGMH